MTAEACGCVPVSEQAPDVLDQDIPHEFEKDLRDDEPDDDHLEARGVALLQLVLEHVEHAVQYFQLLVDHHHALVHLEVLGGVAVDWLPHLVVPEEVGDGEHVRLEVDRGLDDEQLPDLLRHLRLRQGDVPGFGQLLRVRSVLGKGGVDARLEDHELGRLRQRERDGQLLQRAVAREADLVVIEARR